MSIESARQIFSVDPGWRFHRGDIDPPLSNKHISAYMTNKAGWARGAAKPGYDDSDWPFVDLPHDWSVAGPFDPSNHISNGFLPRGVSWYRRYFKLDDADRGKYLALQFDGVSSHCTVYVNGHLLHRNFCGYTPFTIDITDVAAFGEQLNVIAVRADSTPVEGWWYEGAGIYRHVRLIKTGLLHVATYGTFVKPVREKGGVWSTWIETTLENSSDQEIECDVISEILDPDGDPAGRITMSERVAARSSRIVRDALTVRNPRLWSPASPHLYRVQTSLRVDDRGVDDDIVTFGYRTIRFDGDRGFLLNDEPVRLNGTCNHQDHAGVGVAVPDSIHEFRVRRLLEMGSNAYRCAHNPPAPELLDACDRLGMLVMDENRSFGSSPEHLAQLRTMVLRDRNHPSVILWSICNEEAIQGTPTGAAIARAMQQEVKRLDPSRPVTAAVSGGLLNDDCIADSVEVVGINYQLNTYDVFHAEHPNTPVLASETECVYATRGTYETDRERFTFASYDEEVAPWGATARDTWRVISSRPFLAGLFAWTGFDYRGEPTPHGWPCVSTHWGILDTCGFAKDSFYLHKALFTSEPFIHLFPHWNWQGSEGKPIRVMAYTNCDSVKLSLNDESLGRREVDDTKTAEWSVEYRPGVLKAVGYRLGEVAATAMVETTGPAEALGLEVHPSTAVATIPADGQFAVPITVFAADARGRRLPTAEPHVTFALDGPARIIGVGNGDPTCQEADKASARTLFRGLAQVILQTATRPGSIVLKVDAPGLQSASLSLSSTAAKDRPVLPPAEVRHFITGWRMSPVTLEKPDVHQMISEQDMNSWERIEIGKGPQPAWAGSAGYAIYRAAISTPKIIQSSGGSLVFHGISGDAEIFLNGMQVASTSGTREDCLTVPIQHGEASLTVSILIRGVSAAAGLTRSVELTPASSPEQ